MHFSTGGIKNTNSSFHKGANFFKNASGVSRHIVRNPIIRLLPYDIQHGLHKTAEHIENISNGLEKTRRMIDIGTEHTMKYH